MNSSLDQPGSKPLHAVHACIDSVLCPGHFFVGPDLCLAWQPPAREEVSWEIFRGRLLDPAHTRERRWFTSWNIFQIEVGAPSAEPLLSVKWDESLKEIHVVRAILSYVWEGFDDGGNVIQS